MTTNASLEKFDCGVVSGIVINYYICVCQTLHTSFFQQSCEFTVFMTPIL